MDPITHAASGAVAMLALPHRPATRWAVPLAAIAAASPDIDVLFCHTPLQFLQLHRGITHSLAAAPLMVNLSIPKRYSGTTQTTGQKTTGLKVTILLQIDSVATATILKDGPQQQTVALNIKTIINFIRHTR